MVEYRSHQIETGIRHLSESVFMGMCRLFGTSQQVAMRRDMTDFIELMSHELNTGSQLRRMFSGSYREGIRMLGSDMDIMFWYKNERVIWDLSQTRYYNKPSQTLLLTDTSESPPGFTLLQLLTPRTDLRIQVSCVKINDKLYLSSFFYRMIMFSSALPRFTIHGPCVSGNIFGMDIDNAHSFASDFWPKSASSWIDRCHSWPHPQVVRDVVKNGCHFVPIGHKLGNHEYKEWRISFSQAEQKLVYAMNHCQFLTYVLFKVYLKEVFNYGISTEEKLLCSYHMKTAVFWVLQQNIMPNWCPQNFLWSFWMCFKHILKWVYEGVCPNFFIPQNNMFLTKIHGEAQTILFLRLYTLYEMGISCLLQSPSIRSCVINVLCNPTTQICTDERSLTSENSFDAEVFPKLVSMNLGQITCLKDIVKALHTVELVISSHPLVQYDVVILQILTTLILRRTALIVHCMYTDIGANKRKYIADKMSCYMLKLAVKFGFISDILYVAMYHYKTLRYEEALSVIQTAKAKLACTYQMRSVVFTYVASCPEDVRRRSWFSKIRHAVLNFIPLDTDIFYINELMMEQLCLIQTRGCVLFIPTFVLLPALEFLCYCYVDKEKTQKAFSNLQALVHSDDYKYLPYIFRDISWQILGICQQIRGDLQAALYSYQQSLSRCPSHEIQTATIIRIIILFYRLYFS